MVAVAIALSAASLLLSVLHSPILKDACSKLGCLKYMSKLEDLKKTVTTVESVLRDAAACDQVLNNEARNFIEKLKTAVYDADDLFDKFRTLAERKQQQLENGNQLFEKVGRYLSSANSLKVAYKMSKEIKKIKKNLDDIASDHTKFSFAVDSNPIRTRREETCSYVNAPTVIGREADVEAIVHKLLNLNDHEAARFLTVVGIGGMGKTTLAQLVCADQRVKNRFSSNVWWVCVADQDNNHFDKKAILRMILDLATGTNKHHGLSLEEIQTKLSLNLKGRKYLLVLDDLWNDDRKKWMELRDFLVLGDAESRIMVTTRSHDVAKAIGTSDNVHVLKGLSDENSWRLFEMTAFEETPEEHANPLKLKVGKMIVEKCSNIPLAIKVVGSLLWDQDLDKWQSFEKSGLDGIRNHKGENEIMAILKFSYRNLEPSLKSCFTYCALFPKDYVIEKEMLIRLWMAHGYIVPFDRGQSIVEASEEHFMVLQRRCFFQDVKMDEHGNVWSFKMHDLIHDVAQEVAGAEMLVAISETSKLSAEVRHVFENSGVREEKFYSNVKVRSYLRIDHMHRIVDDLQLPVDRIFTNGKCLRTLSLVDVGLKILPDSIGKLLHLRYLDLSGNRHLETLPGSITKLHNLQTLRLQGCSRLRELPKKFSRLVNLMHLNMQYCGSNIKCMPVGMDKLTSLRELSNFFVADESSNGEKQVGQLKDIKALVNLKGRLNIVMRQNVNRTDSEGCFLVGAANLKTVSIEFPRDSLEGSDDEALLEKLVPHPNVIELELWYYRGVKVLSCGKADYSLATLLPNLVTIKLWCCSRLKHLALLSKLKHLKDLTLIDLPELEYIEEASCSGNNASRGTESKEAECAVFPSLESLVIRNVPKLKGWWLGVVFSDSSNNAEFWQRSFPRLFNLELNHGGGYFRCHSSEYSLVVHLGSVEYLKSLPAGRLSNITLNDEEVESLEEVGEVFQKCSSLRLLALQYCCKLTHLPWGCWKQLTTLESLIIVGCKELRWESEEGDAEDGMPWIQLKHLRYMELEGADYLKVLPEGMQHLTSLGYLYIDRCTNLEALPEWISCLSSLQSLTLYRCNKLKSIPEAVQHMTFLKRLEISQCTDELTEGCQEPDGKDWPKIKHIPNWPHSDILDARGERPVCAP